MCVCAHVHSDMHVEARGQPLVSPSSLWFPEMDVMFPVLAANAFTYSATSLAFFHYFWLWQNIHSIKNTTLTILKLTGIKQLLSWDNHHTVNLWNYFCLILVKKLCPLNNNLPNPWVHHSICLYESCCSISYKCNHIVFFSLHTMLSRFTHVLGLFQNFLLLLKLTSCYTGIPYLYFSLLVDERLGWLHVDNDAVIADEYDGLGCCLFENLESLGRQTIRKNCEGLFDLRASLWGVPLIQNIEIERWSTIHWVWVLDVQWRRSNGSTGIRSPPSAFWVWCDVVMLQVVWLPHQDGLYPWIVSEGEASRS